MKGSFQFSVFSFLRSVFSFQRSVIQLLIYSVTLFSCQHNYVPKPGSYFRIDFPEKEYMLYDGDCPFVFEYPVYGSLETDLGRLTQSCWYNVKFPRYRGTIHLTYLKIDDNFDDFIEDNWRIIYRRIAMRADAISPVQYVNEDVNVYGMLFDIHGDAASSVQFFVTDSVRHFLRGSLYFTVRPNADSLAPVVAFFRQDIVHLMESIEWKK